MCELMTMLTVGSTILGAAGAVTQGIATYQASSAQAQVADANARIADRRARDALERGKIEEQKKRQQVAGIVGKQQVAFAANGVDTGFGSPLDTIVDTSVLGELDALTIRTNAYRESYDYRVQAYNQRANAEVLQSQGAYGLAGGFLNAGGTVLTGGSKSVEAYRKYGTSSSFY